MEMLIAGEIFSIILCFFFLKKLSFEVACIIYLLF